jgi:hypothetical protein
MKAAGDNQDNHAMLHGIDLSKCRVREVMHLGWIECLEKEASQCPHALFFGSGFLCRHPDQKTAKPVEG